MSRRKQSNPKPLLKSDCQETAEEMTVERDNKDFCNNELVEEAASTEIDLSEPFSSESVHENSLSPRSSSDLESSSIKHSPKNKINSEENQDPPVTNNSISTSSTTATPTTANMIPKVRLNVSLASDPALKPDAKDIKILSEDIQQQQQQDEIVKKNSIEENSLFNQGQTTTRSPSTDIPHRLKVFMCHPCGIGFSSLSTLEAHQTYYCSHRKDVDEEIVTNNSEATSCDRTSSCEPSTKSIKTGKQYACTQCSYSADKKVSLNRHMRMHQSSPAPSSNTSNGEETSSQQVDRYCSECDIRFSNIKTYRAHKQHYCSSRRTEGQTTPKLDTKKSGSVSPQEGSKTPTLVAPPQPFLALPTNPILIIPYSLVRAASLLPGPLTSVTAGISNPDTTCFSFENGSLQPLATALTTQGLVESTTASSRAQTLCNTTTPLLTEKNSRIINNESTVNSTTTSNNTTITPGAAITAIKMNKREGSNRESAPLDLSVRKSPILKQHHLEISGTVFVVEENKLDIETMMEGKENLSIESGKITPEQIVCAPSLPNSPSMSPSPKRRTISPRGGRAISVSPGPGSIDHHIPLRSILSSDIALKLSESNIIPPLISKQNIELALKLTSTSAGGGVGGGVGGGNKANENSNSIKSPMVALPAAAVATTPINVVPSIPTVQPQMYVKQGVSKCKECNIVFCKFENYLVHKQHYCSARNQDGCETKTNTPPTTGNSSEANSPPIAYHQLICAACGIKYTSLDNLRAHQTFYCPKGGDLTPQIPLGKDKCTKCKTVHDASQHCPSNQGSYKCPVCDVISLTATDSRKHLETHGSVKAFRCSICRYKGNTLRGMRTHIRMHFDKKTSDFNEENYMSCILEEDGVEIVSTAPITQDQHAQGQLFNCEICNYSSSYKGNVMRHMKLVHPQHATSPHSISPEIGEGSEILNQNGDTKQNKCIESSNIKIEPCDMRNNEKDLLTDAISAIKIEPEEKRENDSTTITTTTISSTLSSTSPILTTEENSVKLQTNQKYCQVCDIKFNYMNTYIAHKQFYCKTKRTEGESPSPATIQTPGGVVLGNNKNKENLETVL